MWTPPFRSRLALVGVILFAAGIWPLGKWVFGVGQGNRPPSFVVELSSDVDSTAQLYYDTGNGFNEAQSASVAVKAGAPQVLRFRVAAQAVRALRFDPLRAPGTVTVTRFWAEDPSGTRRRRLSFEEFAPANQIESVGRGGASWRIATTAAADDPQLVRTWPGGYSLPRVPPPWWALLVSGAGLLAWWFGRGAGAFSDAASEGIVAAAVGAVAWGFLWPLHRTLDLPLWDEANYLGWGSRFATTGNLGDIAGSPIYHLWYAVWSRWFPGGAAVFASHYVLKLLVVLLTFLVARRWLASALGAGVVAVAMALSTWVLTFPLLVYHAGFVGFLAALAVADRSRVAAAGFLALAAMTRLEYAFAFGATLVLWISLALIRRRDDRQLVGRSRRWMGVLGLAPLLVAVYAGFHVRGWRMGTERGWFAFQQHYAVSLAEQGKTPGVDPWLEYPQVIARDFPGARSLADAYGANPAAVRAHVERNLAMVPRQALEIFAEPFEGAGRWWGPGLLALVAFWAAVCHAGSRENRWADWWRSRRWSAAVALAGVAAVVPGLVVQAKTAYLLPIVPLVWLMLAALAAVVRTRWPQPASSRLTAASAAAVVLLTAGVAAFAQRPLEVVQPATVRGNVAGLKAALPNPVRVLGLSASSYCVYLGPAYRGIEPLASETGATGDAASEKIPALVERFRPGAVLVTAYWRSLGTFDAAGLERLEASGWRKILLVDGAVYLPPEVSR